MSSQLRKQINYELKTGVRTTFVFYIICLLLFLIIAIGVGVSFKLDGNENVNILDYYMRIFWGIKEFQFMDRLTTFYIPKEWLLVQFPILLISAIFLERDLECGGIQSLIRNQSRYYWWIGKTIWILYATTVYYILFYVIVFVVALLGGARMCNPIISDVSYIPNVCIYIVIFVMPVMVSIVMGFINMFLSVIVSPISAVLFSIAYYVLSVFYMNMFLLLNYTMICRNQYVAGNHGMNSRNGIIIGCIICLLTLMIGVRLFKNKDIYNIER